MAEVRKLAYTIVLLCMVIPLARAQDAVATIQLPDGRTTQLTFTTIDVPGAGVTGVFGINSAGDMVGYYGQNTNALRKHGFLLRSGTFTTIDYTGADATFADGINDSGAIVGSAEFNGGLTGSGFTYDGTTFTPIRIGGQPFTIAEGINNAGDIVGTAGTSGGSQRAFELRGGRVKVINFPGLYLSAVATGINNLDEVVGSTDYTDAYAYKNGKFKNLDFPGAIETVARGVNDDGVIVGQYFLAGTTYGFAFKNGKYLTFSYPGAKATAGLAINTAGQIVGQYQLSDNTFHGFVTSSITAEDLKIVGWPQVRSRRICPPKTRGRLWVSGRRTLSVTHLPQFRVELTAGSNA
jgi:probable HAF family extracellular repeat protein